MKKFKCTICNTEQQYCDRGYTLDQLSVMFAVCHSVSIVRQKKSFILSLRYKQGEFFSWVKVVGLPLSYISKFQFKKP